MDIERLRALEQTWRAAGDAETKRADGDGLSDGEQGWHHGRGEQYDNCADELASLIAELGKEVGAEQAPVADSELPGMWSASDFTGGDPDERCHAERGPVAAQEAFTTWFCLNYPGPHTIISDPNWHAPRIFRQAQWAIKQSSPAHTSEARDAELLDWLRVNEFDLVTRREDIGEDEYAIWWFVVDYRKSTRTNLHTVSGHPLGSPREAIIAAMERQNEGAT